LGSTGGRAERCRRLSEEPVNMKYTTAIAMVRRTSLFTLRWLPACVAARDEARLYRRRTGGRSGREAGRGDWIHAARAAFPGEDDVSAGRGHGHVPLSHAQGPEAQFPVDARCAMARITLPPYS